MHRKGYKDIPCIFLQGEARRTIMKLLAAFYMRSGVAWCRGGGIGGGEQWMDLRGLEIESTRLMEIGLDG